MGNLSEVELGLIFCANSFNLEERCVRLAVPLGPLVSEDTALGVKSVR